MNKRKLRGKTDCLMEVLRFRGCINYCIKVEETIKNFFRLVFFTIHYLM